MVMLICIASATVHAQLRSIFDYDTSYQVREVEKPLSRHWVKTAYCGDSMLVIHDANSGGIFGQIVNISNGNIYPFSVDANPLNVDKQSGFTIDFSKKWFCVSFMNEFFIYDIKNKSHKTVKIKNTHKSSVHVLKDRAYLGERYDYANEDREHATSMIAIDLVAGVELERTALNNNFSELYPFGSSASFTFYRNYFLHFQPNEFGFMVYELNSGRKVATFKKAGVFKEFSKSEVEKTIGIRNGEGRAATINYLTPKLEKKYGLLGHVHMANDTLIIMRYWKRMRLEEEYMALVKMDTTNWSFTLLKTDIPLKVNYQDLGVITKATYVPLNWNWNYTIADNKLICTSYSTTNIFYGKHFKELYKLEQEMAIKNNAVMYIHKFKLK